MGATTSRFLVRCEYIDEVATAASNLGAQQTRWRASNRRKDLSGYLPLYKAALRGKWKDASKFLEEEPNALTAKISIASETVLHVATGTGRSIHFVENLIRKIPPEDLAITNQNGETALSVAAIVGNLHAAKLLVEKNPDLPNIWGKSGLPIHVAAKYGHREMVLYLMEVTGKDIEASPFSDASGASLLTSLIIAGFYDVALHLVRCYPNIATEGISGNESPLAALAGKTSAFPSGCHLNLLQQLIYFSIPMTSEKATQRLPKRRVTTSSNSVKSYRAFSWMLRVILVFISFTAKITGVKRLVYSIKHIWKLKLMHYQAYLLVRCLCTEIKELDSAQAFSMLQRPLHLAAKFGVPEVIEEIVTAFPPAIWSSDEKNCNVFQIAVMNRRENVFNLIYQLSEYKHLVTRYIDQSGNNILHLAGKLAPQHQLDLVSGAALQMQREVQWFKEVEKFVQPAYKEEKNGNGDTPGMVFTREHKRLVEQGEKWMKDTSTSCTVVAALTATVVFAAAITVPGGSDENKGFPLKQKDTAFVVFFISNALSLFSSTTAIMLFLSILTSRYSEEDFLYALPKRLMIGLFTLFVSITSMVFAFTAAVDVVFGQYQGWRLILASAIALFPISSFIFLQFPLLMDILMSTYWPGTFYQQRKQIIH